MSRRTILSHRRLLTLMALCWRAATPDGAVAGEALVHGAGSTMVANYVDASRSAFQSQEGIGVQYDAVGSGEGIRRVATGRVDFALTDVPLTDYELGQLKLSQVPLFYCGVVVIVNLPGVHDAALRLSDRAISEIFAGEITRWRDPEVLRTNDASSVPDLPIVVVHRADTSGTSFVFTSFLSGASETWANRFGLGSRLSWPTGQGVDGSTGMRDAVRAAPGAVGYIEYGIASKEGLTTAQLASGTGDFVRPGPESFRLATLARPAEHASHYQLLTRSPTAGAWPIVATEYALVERTARAKRSSGPVMRFLNFLASGPTLADFKFLPYGARAAGTADE